ncbi:chromate transporter [Nonomuraea sp. 3N208]|uniref:chromate transporter n=1 Tax=Nonomuraea sp. 3N208 TaxID=3457421 RepID=UPI003FD08A87
MGRGYCSPTASRVSRRRCGSRSAASWTGSAWLGWATGWWLCPPTPVPVISWKGAPYVERLRHNTAISAALTGITASVVGVIANLALYFAEHTLFTWAWARSTLNSPSRPR